MNTTAQILLALGGIFMLGLATDLLGRRTPLPRVTSLLILGVVIGEGMLGLIPSSISERFSLITNMALLMVGFLLGGRLTINSFKQSGKLMLWISISAVITTTILITLALWVIGVPLEVALLLGCIAWKSVV